MKHSGNTIVAFCIERAGRSQRLSCSTQGLLRSMVCNLVETTTAIDDLASAFVTTRLKISARVSAGGTVIFNHRSLDKGDICNTSNHSAPPSPSHPLCSHSP